MTVIESLRVFLNVVSDRRYVRVFELLVHLGARACMVVLLRVLRARNLLLLRVPSCLVAAAVHRISVKFPFRSSRDF